MRLRIIGIGLLAALLVPGVSRGQNSATITLGDNNVSKPTGAITLIDQDMGSSTVQTVNGTTCRSTTPATGKTGQYLYFKLDPSFKGAPGSVSDYYVTVNYLDKGTDTFELDYDATNPATNMGDPNNDDPVMDIHRPSGTIGAPNIINKNDTGKFINRLFHLTDVYFGGREEGGADFRINDRTTDGMGTTMDGEGPECIASVTVSKTNPIHLNIPEVSTAPKLDGVLDEPYWKQSDNLVMLCENALDVCQGGCVTDPSGRDTHWQGPNDYCANMRFAWDNTALYIATDVIDDVPRNNDQACGDEYAGDGFEVFWGFDATNASRTAQIDGVDFHWFISAPPKGIDPTWAYETAPGNTTTVMPNGDCSTKGNIVVADRTDGKSGYIMETRIPWSEWKGSDDVAHAPPTANQLILFSMFGNDGDQVMPAANGNTYDQEKALSWSGIKSPSGHPNNWLTIQLGGLAPVAVKGDVNGDGKVDIKDATLSLQIAVGSLMATAAQQTAGDANGDGQLDIKDTTLILGAAVGLRML